MNLQHAEEELRRTQRALLPPPPPPGSVLPADPPKQVAPLPHSLDLTFGDSRSPSSPLRTVFIAPDLVQKFAKAVVQNTLQNVETCGILAGSLVSSRSHCSFSPSLHLFVLVLVLELYLVLWLVIQSRASSRRSHMYPYDCTAAEPLCIQGSPALNPKLLEYVVVKYNVRVCCGCGCAQSNNRFKLTHVLIPKQKGTSDSCDALDELAVYAEQDRLSLITLGWIHVRPPLASPLLASPVPPTFTELYSCTCTVRASTHSR